MKTRSRTPSVPPDSLAAAMRPGFVPSVTSEPANPIAALLDRWCPKGPMFDNEALEVRLTRALMNANGCVANMALAARGEQPIRPLTDYPQPV